MNLKNKVVIVTGASGRIGSQVVSDLIKEKAIVISCDIKVPLKKTLFNFYKLDITKKIEITKFLNFIKKKYNKIDCLIHCAYPTSKDWGTKFEKLKYESLSKNFSIQIGSSIILSQQIIKIFKNQNFGNLILLSSIQGIMAPKFEHYEGTKMSSPIEYSAIKAGIISITKYLSKYVRKSKIRVNCISPGGILDNQPNSFVKAYKKSCNSKGMLDPKDVSNTILFLCDSSSEYINGQNIIVDDGWSL
jgi:NAD(P)-dependent dehydrogenase (short-subunit alcohol dehydrogenase family)